MWPFFGQKIGLKTSQSSFQPEFLYDPMEKNDDVWENINNPQE